MNDIKGKELNQTININVPQHSNGEDAGKLGKVNVFVKTIKKVVDEVANASFLKIIKFFIAFILFIFCSAAAFFCYNVSKNQEAMDKVIDEILVSKKQDEENMKIRERLTPTINYELNKILYSVHASRVAIFELHNGKENTTNLPFRYADMTYEVVNDDDQELRFVSDKFQNIPLTHYNLPYLIEDNYVRLGDVEEARRDDPRFAQLMFDVGGSYYGAVMLRSNGVDIGFLAIFFDKNKKPLDSREEGEKVLREASKTISPLLDLSVQRKENDEKNN